MFEQPKSVEHRQRNRFRGFLLGHRVSFARRRHTRPEPCQRLSGRSHRLRVASQHWWTHRRLWARSAEVGDACLPWNNSTCDTRLSMRRSRGRIDRCGYCRMLTRGKDEGLRRERVAWHTHLSMFTIIHSVLCWWVHDAPGVRIVDEAGVPAAQSGGLGLLPITMHGDGPWKISTY